MSCAIPQLVIPASPDVSSSQTGVVQAGTHIGYSPSTSHISIVCVWNRPQTETRRSRNIRRNGFKKLERQESISPSFEQSPSSTLSGAGVNPTSATESAQSTSPTASSSSMSSPSIVVSASVSGPAQTTSTPVQTPSASTPTTPISTSTTPVSTQTTPTSPQTASVPAQATSSIGVSPPTTLITSPSASISRSEPPTPSLSSSFTLNPLTQPPVTSQPSPPPPSSSSLASSFSTPIPPPASTPSSSISASTLPSSFTPTTPLPSTSVTFIPSTPLLSSSLSPSVAATLTTSSSTVPLITPSTTIPPPVTITPTTSSSTIPLIPSSTTIPSLLSSSFSTPTATPTFSTFSTPTATPIFSPPNDSPVISTTLTPWIPPPWNAFTSTFTTTKYWSSTLPGGSVTTLSTIVETGILSTNIPGDGNKFSRNTGAIIGVAIAGTTAVILTVFVTFFACRRYKGRRSHNGSSVNQALNRSPPGSWRPPLEGDDDDDDAQYYTGQYGGLIAALQQPLPPSSLGHSQYSADAPEGDGLDLANHDHDLPLAPENTGTPPRRSHSFGKQPYMPGIGQAMLTTVDDNGKISPPLPYLPPRKLSNEQAIWFAVDPQVPTAVSSSNGHTSPYENRSAASLDAYASVSSHGQGAATSSSGHGITTSSRGPSSDNPRPSVPQTHSQTPPSSFTLRPRPKSKDSLDSKSIRSFIGRLRGSKTSVPDVIVQDMSMSPGSQESIVSRAVSIIRPRSTPPVPPAHIPPVSHMSDFLSRNPSQERNYLLPPNMTPAGLWPSTTLPPFPSPAASINASDESGTLENLLHPRLMIRTHSNADSSSTSLRDHVDYSRPIGGLINNRMQSTTTFNTQDTTESLTMTEETVEA